MRIISGGQAGVDRAVLDVAIERGIPYDANSGSYGAVSPTRSRIGEPHGQRKRPQHQEKAEVQELRG
jgi:hypothetical protein